MRPRFIMGSAVVIALLMAGAVTLYSITAPAPIPIHTKIEEPGDIKLNPAAANSDLGCVAILTAPVSMRVDHLTKVETTLLVAAGPVEIASLHQAVKSTETSIDTASPSSPIDPSTGLDKISQRCYSANGGQQSKPPSQYRRAPWLANFRDGSPHWTELRNQK